MSVDLIDRTINNDEETNRLRLPDQSDSSENEESSPRKRPRSDHSNIGRTDNNTKENWDHYVRSGSKLKSLAGSILDVARHLQATERIQTHQQNLGDVDNNNNHDECDNAPKFKTVAHPLSNTNDNAAKLAYEKTAECLMLEKKLKEAEVHHDAMMAANASLRESASATNDRMERTVEALRIASTNAANARTDADTAEAYAASLASQLESLRNIVQETKRATKILHDEHAQVTAATRSVESKLLMRETELLHLQTNRKVILSDKDKLTRDVKELMGDKQKLIFQLERAQDQIKSLLREIEERDALEHARKDRSAMVENELRNARSLLVDASSNAAETETTSSVLKETVETFIQENTSLHAKLEEIQERSRAKEERLQEALGKTENNAQTLRINATSHDEQINHLLSEKVGYEKQINQLKSRIANLENRLKDTIVFMSPSPTGRYTVGEPSTEPKARKIAFSVPSLTPAVTNKSPAASKSVTCCMCYKPPSGLMKTCQCGKPNCDKRAHSTCLGKSKGRSLSHPGSPSPCLPIVLCQRT